MFAETVEPILQTSLKVVMKHVAGMRGSIIDDNTFCTQNLCTYGVHTCCIVPQFKLFVKASLSLTSLGRLCVYLCPGSVLEFLLFHGMRVRGGSSNDAPFKAIMLSVWSSGSGLKPSPATAALMETVQQAISASAIMVT